MDDGAGTADLRDDRALQAMQATQTPIPVRPQRNDFTVDGKSLFDEFNTYVRLAEDVVTKAREISEKVHGKHPLTLPP